MATKSIMASFRATASSPVSSSAYHDGYTYLGGSDGILYRTVDGSYFDEFWRISDGIITSIASYGGALFIGTSPYGNVYMHNSNTGNRFHYLISGDSTVSAMTVHDDTLYVGTSRSGMVFSFNGDEWNKEYEALKSVSSMVSFDDALYVFFEDSASVVKFGEGGWSFLKDGDSVFSISGKRSVTSSVEALFNNPPQDSGVGGATVMGDKIYFYGTQRSVLYSYDGQSVSVEYQFGSDAISSVASSEKQVFVSAGEFVYVSQTDEEESSDDSGGEDDESN